MTSKVLDLYIDHASLILKASLFLAFCAVLSYGLFLNASIRLTVERQDMESARAELGGKVAILEMEYLKRTENIALSTAESLGFAQARNIVYTSRVSTVASLSSSVE